MADPLLFFDSGVGGLPYLERLRAKLPDEECVYVADSRHFPYGDRSSESIRISVVETMGSLIECFKPKAVVIACNTATVAALKTLRERFSIPFIGVVPAVKPAAEQSARRRIGVFATSRTVEDAYTRDLIRNFASDCTVLAYPGGETVTYIEERFLYETETRRAEYVRRLAEPFKRDSIDTLVLGCTHFIYLIELLQKILGSSVRIIESREGVGRQIVRVLTEQGLLTAGRNGPDRLYSTEITPARERILTDFCTHFGIDYSGRTACH